MSWRARRDRHLRDPWPRQLGNLASTLARLASRCADPRHDGLTRALLRETALMLDWSAPEVEAALWPELAAAQREVVQWWRIWPVDPARGLLRLRARQLSDRILALSGL
ncbi:MAG: hypothetical protein ACRELA_24380 [Candidatus Rokuibacteriota bacterium]